MDTHEALRTRRTIHRYLRDEVARERIDAALALAILAPNHRSTWPWRFVVVGRETRSPLADLAVRLKTRDQPLADDIQARIRGKVLDPAWLIVVSRVHCNNPVIAREDYAAVACAIQNLHLALHADGIGSKWSSGALTTHPETYEQLGIDNGSEEIVGFVWVGLAADDHPAPPRPPLASFVREMP